VAAAARRAKPPTATPMAMLRVVCESLFAFSGCAELVALELGRVDVMSVEPNEVEIGI
jgi:hypothetical protein